MGPLVCIQLDRSVFMTGAKCNSLGGSWTLVFVSESFDLGLPDLAVAVACTMVRGFPTVSVFWRAASANPESPSERGDGKGTGSLLGFFCITVFPESVARRWSIV